MIKLRITWIIDKIEDLFRKKLGYNDRQTNTIRIQLQKDMETYSLILKICI